MKFTFPPESKPLDGYTIKRAIHKGGFGEVYYALSDHGKEVALKLLHENTDVELRGVSQCLNLKHPNLVTIFDIKRDADGDYWIVMEYVSGRSLDIALASYPNGMPINEVSHWLSGMAAGLSYLHDKGIVHRDLKPANIFSESEVVKIGDVGLAKFISESRRNAQTESVGTVYYMAPEVARGHYGHEVDVYSLGIVLYEMLTGRVPFDGESTAEILMKHLSERPDLNPIPERLRPVLARALEKDPLKRTASVAQLHTEFQRAIGSRPAEAPQARAFDQTIGPDVRPVVDAQPQPNSSPPPLPPRIPPVLHPYADKYVRKYEKKAAKWAEKRERWAERHRKRAEKYARRYEERQQLASNPNYRRRSWGDAAHVWIRVAAVCIVLLAIFRPGAMRALLVPIAVGSGAAFLAWGTYRALSFGTPVPPPRVPVVPELAASPIFDEPLTARPVQSPPRRPQENADYRGRFLDPSTQRYIPLRNRMIDLTGSMTFAVVASGVVTLVLSSFTALLPELPQAAVFGTLTLLGSWTVMAASKMLEGYGPETSGRRILFLALGAGVGVLAWWLNGAFLTDTTHAAVFDPIFTSVGKHPLAEASGAPTLVGYLVFFGGLFALRRWWWHADAFRSKRFRVWSVLMTAAMGFLVSWLWQFPQVWGVTLAAAMSAVVQLSSAWVPQSERTKVA